MCVIFVLTGISVSSGSDQCCCYDVAEHHTHTQSCICVDTQLHTVKRVFFVFSRKYSVICWFFWDKKYQRDTPTSPHIHISYMYMYRPSPLTSLAWPLSLFDLSSLTSDFVCLTSDLSLSLTSRLTLTSCPWHLTSCLWPLTSPWPLLSLWPLVPDIWLIVPDLWPLSDLFLSLTSRLTLIFLSDLSSLTSDLSDLWPLSLALRSSSRSGLQPPEL